MCDTKLLPTELNAQGALVMWRGEHERRTFDAGGFTLPTTSRVDRAAFARRLAACWNACDGMPTDILETAGAGAPNAREWFDAWNELHTLHVANDRLGTRLDTVTGQRNLYAASLRTLADNAAKLVQMLKDTGRAPPCMDLTGLREAQELLAADAAAKPEGAAA